MVDHGIWETSEAGNRRVIGRIFDLFRQIFPNTPVYSTIGNHEGKMSMDDSFYTIDSLLAHFQLIPRTCKFVLPFIE